MASTIASAATPALAVVVHTNYAASKQVSIPIGFEMLAIVVATVTGVLEARENKLDLVGSIALGVICSLGGGIIRDVILQVGDVYVLEQPLALPVALITAVIVFIVPEPLTHLDRLIEVLDIFAVGLFTVTGADKALSYEFSPIVCVMMGFFTGVGGGALRDMCLARVPHIFKSSNLYAIASIVGAVVYVLLVGTLGIYNVIAAVIGVATTMLTRWLSLRYNIKSPTEVDLSKLWASIKARLGGHRS